MKTNITIKTNSTRILTAILLLLVTTTSCNLDVIPPADIAAENFWQSEKDAWYGLNAIYETLGSINTGAEMSSDNAFSHKSWEGDNELRQTNAISSANDFGYNFGTIRLVNNFIEKVKSCKMQDKLRDRMIAEARFFRAKEYMDLVVTFGKVPLITSVLPYDAPNVKRDEITIIQKFVLDELTDIAEILPAKYPGGFAQETSRITRSAALAVKAQAALNFKEWSIAEKAASKIIIEGNHSLFRLTDPLNIGQQREADEMDQYIDFQSKGINKDKFIRGLFSYTSIWHDAYAKPSNPEYILTKEYLPTPNNSDWARYLYFRPAQLVKGYASFSPMQDLVSTYWDIDGKTIRKEPMMETRKEMFENMLRDFIGENGKMISQSLFIKKMINTDISKYPYMAEFRNRDSRLYASILFPYKGWHETDFPGPFYFRMDPDDIGGAKLDENWSGYNFRKIVSLAAYNTDLSYEDYPVIRYAEVLLIFAEAHIQALGYDEQVRTALNDIRDRAGMPNVPASFSSKQDALDFVRNERRIELAGEGQRFNDIRRYGKEYCAKVMNGKTYAPHGYTLVNKIWDDRLMLMPIPQDAIDKNPQLDQNSGY